MVMSGSARVLTTAGSACVLTTAAHFVRAVDAVRGAVTVALGGHARSQAARDLVRRVTRCNTRARVRMRKTRGETSDWMIPSK